MANINFTLLRIAPHYYYISFAKKVNYPNYTNRIFVMYIFSLTFYKFYITFNNS